MDDDRNFRDAILLLVNACNDYQIRNLTLISALRALERYQAKKRGSVCECELQTEALKAYHDAEAVVEAQAKEIMSALQGSEPFLDVLTRFATRHYLDFGPTLSRLRIH